MKILGSLTNRIFLASAALAVVSIAAAVYFVSRTTTRQAEAELQRGLIEAGTLVDQQCATLVQTLTVMARLVADAPRLKAAVDTGDPPTVQPLAREYQEQLERRVARVDGQQRAGARRSGRIRDVADGHRRRCRKFSRRSPVASRAGFWPQANGVVQVGDRADHDRPRAARDHGHADRRVPPRQRSRRAVQARDRKRHRLRRGRPDQGLDASAGDRERLASLLTREERADCLTRKRRIRRAEAAALPRPAAEGGSAAPTVLLLRSRTERLRFLNAINTGLGIVAMVAVLAATILSYAVARTITGPSRPSPT